MRMHGRARAPIEGRASVRVPPAARAWSRLSGVATGDLRATPLQTGGGRTAVFRVENTSSGDRLVAKRAPEAIVRYEAEVYDLLVRLAVPVPRLRGVLVGDGAGRGWLFLEDVGDGAFDETRREHRELAGRWLAQLHGLGRRPSASFELADRSDRYYRRRLVEAHGSLLAFEGSTSDDAVVVGRVAERLERLDAAWPVVASDAASLATTLVHGDFVAKNVRVAGGGSAGSALAVIDWETAGRGSPAVDLPLVDLASYRAWRGDVEVDAGTLARTARAGRAFRLVSLVGWAAEALASEGAERALSRQLPYYEAWLRELVDALEEGRT
jgi:aminoglycoside phosphotransferase (APT) family kinase protein